MQHPTLKKNEVLENPFIHIHRKARRPIKHRQTTQMYIGAITNRIIEEMLKAATFMVFS